MAEAQAAAAMLSRRANCCSLFSMKQLGAVRARGPAAVRADAAADRKARTSVQGTANGAAVVASPPTERIGPPATGADAPGRTPMVRARLVAKAAAAASQAAAAVRIGSVSRELARAAAGAAAPWGLTVDGHFWGSGRTRTEADGMTAELRGMMANHREGERGPRRGQGQGRGKPRLRGETSASRDLAKVAAGPAASRGARVTLGAPKDVMGRGGLSPTGSSTTTHSSLSNHGGSVRARAAKTLTTTAGDSSCQCTHRRRRGSQSCGGAGRTKTPMTMKCWMRMPRTGMRTRGGGPQEGGGPDPSMLRAAYEEHARAVKDLERRGRHGPALDTLRQARDAAEQAWRGAKEPAPLAKRMAWAEAKLHKAETALTRARYALDEFDQDTDRRREQLVARINEADEWYRWRQNQLDSLHAEAGEKAAWKHGAQGNGAGAEVRRKIRGHMLPEVQAILEDLPGGTPAHERLTLLAASLAEAEQVLDDGDGGDGAQHFNMDDGDAWDGDWGEGEDGLDADARDSTRPTTAGGEGTKGGRPAEWRPEGPGRWTRRAGDAESQKEKQAEAQLGANSSASSGIAREGTAGAGAPAAQAQGSEVGRRSDGGNDLPAGAASSNQGAEDTQSEERSAKHRRTAPEGESREESDARRARELHQQQSLAAAAQMESYEAGMGGFGSDVALSLAAQKYVQEVQDAQRRAKAKGIEPRANGKDLIQLTPMELQAWVEANLSGEEQ